MNKSDFDLLLAKVKQEGNKKVFEYKGYNCIIRRIMKSGHLCGYVEIPENNKLYEKSYKEIEDIDVHGGITFSDWGFGEDKDFSSEKWYIGFDLHHAYDLAPFMYLYIPKLMDYLTFDYETYKDMDYATEQCKKLVDQINTND